MMRQEAILRIILNTILKANIKISIPSLLILGTHQVIPLKSNIDIVKDNRLNVNNCAESCSNRPFSLLSLAPSRIAYVGIPNEARIKKY